MKHNLKLTALLAVPSLFLSVSFGDEAKVTYPQVATGQVKTYNNNGEEVKDVKEGELFYGQDAHYLKGAPMAFKDNGDGTVTDLNTGLTWQIDPPKDGFSWQEASDYCDNLELGGHSDWRLPTAKELFSISDFSEGWPYINSEYFKLVNNEHIGKDEQYWTSNKYLGSISRGGHNGAFGVNHATGHIKTYSAGGQGGPQGGQGGQGPQGGPPQGGQGGPQGAGPQGGAPQGGAPQGGGPQGDHVMGPQGARPMGQSAPIAFADLDKDGDGKLSEEEFKAAMASQRQGGPQGGPPQGGQGGPQGGPPQGGPQGGAPQGAAPSSTGTEATASAAGTRPQRSASQSASPQTGGPQGGPQGGRPMGQAAPPAFADLDKDGDGKLSEEEFKAAMANQRPGGPQGGPPQGGQGGPQGGAPQGGQQAGGPPPQGGQAGGAPRGNPAAKQVRAVRGTPYGINKFVDNGDGTITDEATGLMWSQADSEKGMDWESALAYAENSELAGHSDWRLPNVKELQAILNYDRAPNSSDPSKEGPAIDPIFSCSNFTNDKGVIDYPYFWTGTSALFRKGTPYVYAWYVAFGRAVGGDGEDSHGAGGVRFDTKHKDGPAGEDSGRIYNYVRLVRDIK